MNWLTITILGAVAAWFEYNYQRSRRKKNSAETSASGDGASNPVPLPVAQPGEMPSISPGSENDKRMNTAV